MNENIDLTKILKDCPEGTKFYTSIHGEVYFFRIDGLSKYPVVFMTSRGGFLSCLPDGRYNEAFDGECIVFPSKDQRDWSKFAAPWCKKEKFDPKTLKPFDKVLACDLEEIDGWVCGWFSYYNESGGLYPCRCVGSSYRVCIPYNDETKHLVGTAGEVPEYYKYWEE